MKHYGGVTLTRFGQKWGRKYGAGGWDGLGQKGRPWTGTAERLERGGGRAEGTGANRGGGAAGRGGDKGEHVRGGGLDGCAVGVPHLRPRPSTPARASPARASPALLRATMCGTSQGEDDKNERDERASLWMEKG